MSIRRRQFRARVGLGHVFALAAMLVGGCAARPHTEGRRPPWRIAEAHRGSDATSGASNTRGRRPTPDIRGVSEASDFVVANLQGAGLRFGTDGRVASLWGYLRTSHGTVDPTAARAQDVVFFRLDGADKCEAPDHAGLVQAVDRQGRMTFLEARGGEIRRSYVDPAQPTLRRAPDGRVHNSFLRTAKISDPAGTPLFAGEMLCGVARPRPPQ